MGFTNKTGIMVTPKIIKWSNNVKYSPEQINLEKKQKMGNTDLDLTKFIHGYACWY